MHNFCPLPQVKQEDVVGTKVRWPKIVKAKQRIMGSICLKRTLEEAVKGHQKTTLPQAATGVAEHFGVSTGAAAQPQWALPRPFLF